MRSSIQGEIMAEPDALSIQYTDHPKVTELIDVITFCTEGISFEFKRWDEPYVQGPGLYFVIVAGTSIESFADPMGENQWPIEICQSVTESEDAFFEAAQDAAMERDGAVVVTVDGYIQKQMVRLKDLGSDDISSDINLESIEYDDWMGARHMSALDTSAREEVVATVTLSEESGRVTVFQDTEYESYTRDTIGGEWRYSE